MHYRQGAVLILLLSFILSACSSKQFDPITPSNDQLTSASDKKLSNNMEY